MIIFEAEYGQLSNRLILMAHAFASSMEYEHRIICLSNNEYLESYCCNGKLSKVITMKDRSRFWGGIKLYHRMCNKLLRNVGFYNEQENQKKLLNRIQKKKSNKKYYINSWMFRDYPSVEKQKTEIRKFFMPKEKLIEDVRECWDRRFDNYITIIGVHIRRGDYANWHNGKYFYDDRTYRNILLNLQNIFDINKAAIVLFSNEKISYELYRGLDNVYVSPGKTAVEDHWLMSKCSYLIGPPSTFTRWAAYIGGNVPLYYIEDSKRKISIEDFRYQSI